MQNKTTLLIYNPRAGKNWTRPKPETLLKALGPLSASTHLAVTAYPGHAREIASVEGSRYRTVICCGGEVTDVRIDVKNEAIRLFSSNGVHFGRSEHLTAASGIPDYSGNAGYGTFYLLRSNYI